MGEELVKSIHEKSRNVTDPAGRTVFSLGEKEALELGTIHALNLHQVYRQAMASGITPCRYVRNREALSLSDQIQLSDSCVAVVGAGGLGGHVLLLLARLGIGRLIVIDHDFFDETNLNRQALSTVSSLGNPKSAEAVFIIESVNPAVEVTAHDARINESNGLHLIAGAQIAVDALDSIQDRLILEGITKKMGVPLVHGALAGFEGEVMTIFPEDAGLRQIYNSPTLEATRRPEAVLGVPSVTASFIATLQVMEVLKVLLGRGKIFRNRMAYADLDQGVLQQFSFR